MEGGSSRHAVIYGRLQEGSTCLDPRQQINLLLLTLLLRPTMSSDADRRCTSVPRATFAKRWRWAESGLLWLGRDQLVGVLKEGKIDSSAPRHTAHIAATHRTHRHHVKLE